MYFFAFYPIGIDPRTRRQPVLTYALIAIMGVLFLWLRYGMYALPVSPVQLVFFPGNGAPWTVVTALFLHAGWLHYLGNMVYLWVFGSALEARLGPVRFLLCFLMVGAFGNLVHGMAALNGWLGAGGLGVLGVSGAVAGLLALTLARCPFGRVVVAYWVLAGLQGQSRAGRARLGMPVAVGVWLLLQAVYSMVAEWTGDGVSYAAHLGGFVMGGGVAFVLGLPRDGRAEACLVRGRRYLEQGQIMAAVGAFKEYVQAEPQSRRGRLELARALRMANREDEAAPLYRAVFAADVLERRLDRAVRVFGEVRRGRLAAEMDPDLLAVGALYQDRQLDFAAALRSYQDLVEHFPEHPRRDFALVRIATLLRGPLGHEEEALGWVRRAIEVLPPGAWRDYLAAEHGIDMTS